MDNHRNGHETGRSDGSADLRGKPGRRSIPPDAVRCTARAKQSQLQCRNYREPGMVVCRFHGGGTPVGIASPHTETGRYSRVLPRQLAERFERLAADEDILDMGRDLALLDARAEELLTRLDSGESTASWANAKAALTRLRTSLSEGNASAIRDAMGSLQQILSDAAGRESTWRDIREILQERRLIVESERRRLVDLHQMVTVEELMLFARAIVGIVNRHVTDRSVRTAVALGIRDLVHHTGRPMKTIASFATPVTGPDPTAGGRNGTG